MSVTPLTKLPILRPNENPHELLIIKCSSCLMKSTSTRQELHESGWQVAYETQIKDHEGFTICPECSPQEYVWEDLY